LGKGLGLLLQRADSMAAEVFIEAFTRQGRPLLPVHDGYYFWAEDMPLFESLRPDAEAAVYKFLVTKYPQLRRHPLPMKFMPSPSG
jgi:hypothetical protein